MNWRKLKAARWLRDKFRSIKSWNRFSDWSPRNIKWAIKCRFIHKTNKVHVKRFSDWGWADRCSVIRHLPFIVLTEFIEKEKPFERIVTDEPPQDKDWAELKELYEWYKNYEEFDSFKWMEKRLGYVPSFGWDSEPIEESGVDEWEDPKMYAMNFHKKSSTEEQVFADSLQAEREFEEEFTRKACRIIELYHYLWV